MFRAVSMSLLHDGAAGMAAWGYGSPRSRGRGLGVWRTAPLYKKSSYSAKAEYPVRRARSIPSLALHNTGSSAFADDDDSDSIFKQPRQFQTRLRIPAARCARVVHESFAQKKQRAWGMPGARRTHSLACNMGNKAHERSHHRYSRDHPAFPHAMVLTAYFVLSPVSEFVLSPSSGIKGLSDPVGPTCLR